MQGITRFKVAIERYRENKDINLKYKTPLTSKSAKLSLRRVCVDALSARTQR